MNPISINEIDESLANAVTQYKKTLTHLARQQATNTKSTPPSSSIPLLYPRSWVKNEIKLGKYPFFFYPALPNYIPSHWLC